MKKTSGAIALLGGGEWTEPCRALDSRLLHLADSDEVLIVPTAAAFENPDDAVGRATAWFAQLGATAKGLPGAIFAYNHANWYVAEVLALASEYAKNSA